VKNAGVRDTNEMQNASILDTGEKTEMPVSRTPGNLDTLSVEKNASVRDTGKIRNAGVRDTGESEITGVPDTSKTILDCFLFFISLKPFLKHLMQQSIKKQSKSSINYTNTFE